MNNQQKLPIRDKIIVFKRWDNFTDHDAPEAMALFATPVVLPGLFTFANYDQVEPNGTIAFLETGCGGIIHSPCPESKTEKQRAVIGVFDSSERACAPKYELIF